MPLPTLPHCRWLPPSSKPAHALAFRLDPSRPKTCRLASHMHIKPGELENTLLARELEELPGPRAVGWSQALGLTTFDPGFFLFLCPSYLLSSTVQALYVLLFCFLGFFFEGLEKESSISTVSYAGNFSTFSLSSCMSRFSSSFLVPATVALFV